MSEDKQVIEETNIITNNNVVTETTAVIEVKKEEEEKEQIATEIKENEDKKEEAIIPEDKKEEETLNTANNPEEIKKEEQTPNAIDNSEIKKEETTATEDTKEETLNTTNNTENNNNADDEIPKTSSKPEKPKMPPKPRHAPPPMPPPSRPPPKPPVVKKEEAIEGDDTDTKDHPDLLGLKSLSFSNLATQAASTDDIPAQQPPAATTAAAAKPTKKTPEEIEKDIKASILEVSSILDSNPSTPESKAECYKRLLDLSKSETFADLAKSEFIYSGGKDIEGRFVVVLIGSRIPADTVPYERLLLYFIKTLDAITEGLYSIVYIASNQSSANRPATSWLFKAYGVLPRRYKKNIKQLLIVQCSVWVKLLLGMCYPFISKKFWKKLIYINNSNDLSKYLNVSAVHFPSAVMAALSPSSSSSSSSSSGSSGNGEADQSQKDKPVLFKRHLAEVAQCPQLLHCGVPTVVYDCLKYLMKNGTSKQGILRLSGDREAINECVACYEWGSYPNFDAIASPHTVVNLLKLYLRELPEPLVTFDVYERLIGCSESFAKECAGLSKEEQVKNEVKLAEAFGKVLEDLPAINRAILYNLFCFLVLVGFEREQTNMPPTNIATCIGPSIMWMRGADLAGPLDPMKVLYDTQHSNNIARILVTYHECIPKSRCLFEAPDYIKEKISLN